MIRESFLQARLSDCAQLLSGGTPRRKRAELWGGSIPWVSAKDMKTFRLRDTQEHVTAQGVEEGTRVVGPYAVLVLVRGMTLHNDVPICVTTCEMAFNQDVKALVPNQEVVHKSFFPYLVLALKPRLQSLVGSASHGTGRILTDQLRDLTFELPPLPEQRAIARVLGALDDKIELNREMNRTLETTAQALFKSWFVDFDPVVAKADGRKPFGMSEKTAALFPDRFVKSELGLIPEGWRIGRLKELLVLQRGFDLPKKSRVPGIYSVVAAGGFIGTHAEAKVQGPGVVTGRSGKLGVTYVVEADFWPLNTTLWVKQFRDDAPYFAYFLLSQLGLARLNAGSAVPTLNRNHVHNLSQALPPRNIVAEFHETVTPLFERKTAARQESDTLAALRELLLPKLLSGEIRVGEAEEAVEAVGG